MNRRRSMIRTPREASRREYVFVASRQGSPVACIVSTSVVPVPGVRHVRRPAIAAATAGRALGGPGARSTGANGARGGSSGRGSGPGEGNAAPSIRKGTWRIIRGRRVSVSGKRRVRGYHGTRACQTRRTCKWLLLVMKRALRVIYLDL